VKVSDVVNDRIREINTKAKELKQADRDDLGELSQAFDEIAKLADEAATWLENADQALAGSGDGGGVEGDDDTDEDDGGEDDGA